MLCIKRAAGESVMDDMQAFQSVAKKVHGNTEVSIDICAVTEDLEWLMHGKVIDPTMFLCTYQYVVVFVHSGNVVFDVVQGMTSAYSPHTFFMYRLSDTMFHHAERLHTLVKTNQQGKVVKFPHQKHSDMRVYNENFTPVEDIVRAHFRELFLPIDVIDTDHLSHIHVLHKKDLARTASDFATIIHERRHRSDSLTFRENIAGPTVWVVTIPRFRKKDVYTSIPLTWKEVNGLGVWDIVSLTQVQRDEIMSTVEQVSRIAFNNQVVVYSVSVHPTRGVFIQSTAPLMSYFLHQPDFFFNVARESAISPLELFVLLGYNS